MILTLEHRTRTVAWSVATALHVCAGVLILRTAAWGDTTVKPPAVEHAGLALVTLLPTARASTSAPTIAHADSTPRTARVPPAPTSSLAIATLASTSAASSGQGAPSTGVGPRAASDLSGVDADQFRQALLDRIDNFKQYPLAAVRERVQGTVWVRFLLGHDGQLLGVWVDQSSGQRILDDEAVAAIKRAAPFSAIPAGLPDRLDLTLAIPFAVS